MAPLGVANGRSRGVVRRRAAQGHRQRQRGLLLAGVGGAGGVPCAFCDKAALPVP
ncbi:MAG: hypothetical protein M5U34_03130 [Chloroflexi bacterium]|nr:hypothetical protein [Chloroflexota bacterium]